MAVLPRDTPLHRRDDTPLDQGDAAGDVPQLHREHSGAVVRGDQEQGVQCRLAKPLTVSIAAQLTRSVKQTFVLDFIQLLHFLVYPLITVPPNYVWELWLENTFPAFAGTPEPETQRLLPIVAQDVTALDDKQKEAEPTETEDTKRLNIRNTFAKWFLDVILVGSPGNVTAFLVVMGLLKGETWAAICNNLHKEAFGILLDSYKLYAIPQIINFIWVPAEKRVVFLALINLLWWIYLSFAAARI